MATNSEVCEDGRMSYEKCFKCQFLDACFRFNNTAKELAADETEKLKQVFHNPARKNEGKGCCGCGL